jgi:hypothetical protein
MSVELVVWVLLGAVGWAGYYAGRQSTRWKPLTRDERRD